jgi:hypothetical protein
MIPLSIVSIDADSRDRHSRQTQSETLDTSLQTATIRPSPVQIALNCNIEGLREEEKLQYVVLSNTSLSIDRHVPDTSNLWATGMSDSSEYISWSGPRSK